MGENYQNKTGDVRVEPTTIGASFDDLAGFDNTKQLINSILPRFDPEIREELLKHYGTRLAQPDQSLLLFGPAGCGKTLAAEAIANEIKISQHLDKEVQFFNVYAESIDSPESLSTIFELLSKKASEGIFAVVHFENVETIAPDRAAETSGSHDRRLTNTYIQRFRLLTQEIGSGFITGTSTFPMKADSTVINGFAKQQFVPPPSAESMAEFWRNNFNTSQTTEKVQTLNYERLGEGSKGYTPGEITDRVMPEIRNELTNSVASGEPIALDTELVLTHIENTAPVTVPEYISEAAEIKGVNRFPELCEFIEHEAEKHDIS